MIPTSGLEMGVEAERLTLLHIEHSLCCEVAHSFHSTGKKESKFPGIPKAGLG